MKYIDIINAYKVIQKLSNMDFSVRDAYAIYNIRKSLEPTIAFGAEREKCLIEKYNGAVAQDGGIKFFDESCTEEEKAAGLENMTGFVREMQELNESEIDIDITQITLLYDSFGDQKITPNEIMVLEGFVKFE